MNKQEISDYYDEFAKYQKGSLLNERILALYQKIKRAGLNNGSNVLELGCGIGSFSFLLSKVVKKGHIECVDISSGSIEYAKSKIKGRNARFVAADITLYEPELKYYDFITLFDVIEHIPLKEHELLFKHLGNLMNEQTQLLINIPNPLYIEYDRIHHPELLQIVDEAVYLNTFADVIFRQGLRIESFQTHSVWVKDDYQYMVIKKNIPFQEIKLSSQRTWAEKIKARLKRRANRLFYRF